MTHTNPISSQNDQILAALLQGDKITPIDALNRFGCFRLSGRIHNIKSMGYPIKSELIKVGEKRVAQYSLIKN